MSPNILIIEDDLAIAELVRYNLAAEGYRVAVASTGEEAEVMVDEDRFDLVVLDWMLPGLSGIELCRRLRRRDTTAAVPILMLTARGEAESRIEGLECGADDYVGKPFEPRELSLRIGNILKRARPAPAPQLESVRFGEFIFNLGRGELKRGDEVIHLTDREREMMRLLATAPGETVTRLDLAGGNGNGNSIGERAVDVQINRLRRKIERDPTNPLFIQTARGIGYRLVTTP